MPQQLRALSDDELRAIFNDDRADLSLLTDDEQQRLLTLTDDQAQPPETDDLGNPVFKSSTSDVQNAAIAKQLQRTDLPDDVRAELEALSGPQADTRPVMADVAIGGAKGAANSGLGLAKLFYQAPGIRQASDEVQRLMVGDVVPGGAVIDAARGAYATPTNTAQKVGFYGEQIGEMFIPNGAVANAAKKGQALTRLLVGDGKAARVAGKVIPRTGIEAGVGGGMTYVQTDNPTDSTVSAVTSAIMPGARGAREAGASFLQSSAARNVSQALAPTTKRLKRVTEQITPEMLKRGTFALTKGGLASKAERELDVLGGRFDDANAALPTGDRLGTADVRAPIQAEMQALMKTGSSGKAVPVNPAKFEALKQLDTTLDDLGDRVSRETLQAFKEEWAEVAANAGGYAERSGDALSQASKWAHREGADAIRRVLAQDSPDIAKLNAEWSFWSKVREVSEASLSREKPQKGALRRMGGLVGGTAGLLSGGPNAALAGTAIGSQVMRVIDSPGWKLANAHAKTVLADALMSANTERINLAISRIVGTVPGAFRPAPTAP